MTRDEANKHVSDLANEYGKNRQGDFHQKLEDLGPGGRKGVVQALGLKTDSRLPFRAASPLLEKHGQAVAEAAIARHHYLL